MNLKIIVATHKKYWMPKDEIYLPIHAGAAGKKSIGYAGDDTGENISHKNPNYCELTAHYWGWKNLKADYIGLVHYRRYFTTREDTMESMKRWNILDAEKWENLLQDSPVIVPGKRKYYIESNYSHYIHAHHKEPLDVTGEIIKEKYPEYAKAWYKVMNRTWAHMFNMFVMRKDFFDRYSEYLFDILGELEKRVDISSYDEQEARVYGYVSELMLDVWLETNDIPYKEQNVTFMENQNWLKKGGRFLWRKIKGNF